MTRLRLRLLLCALAFVPLLAVADPKTADEWYKEGETQYNLGNFDKAADAFKEGFSLETNDSKKPAYLYNIAQSYRYGNRCRESAFFYKRYLSLKEQDTAKPLSADRRAQTEQFIKELEECAKNQDNTHLNGSGNPMGSGEGSGSAEEGSGSGTRVAVNGSDEGSDDVDTGVHAGTTVEGPKVLTARFTGGGAKVTAGGLNVPLQSAFGVEVGYPVMKTPALTVDVGVAGQFTPVKYANIYSGESQTASMTTVLANVGATYNVGAKLGVRGDLGAGMLFFGGINQMGSPFTESGNPTSGTLAMFALRVAASVDYLVTPNIFITATPAAFSYSPAKKGMREDIKSLTQFDFMVGLGYRM